MIELIQQVMENSNTINLVFVSKVRDEFNFRKVSLDIGTVPVFRASVERAVKRVTNKSAAIYNLGIMEDHDDLYFELLWDNQELLQVSNRVRVIEGERPALGGMIELNPSGDAKSDYEYHYFEIQYGNEIVRLYRKTYGPIYIQNKHILSVFGNEAFRQFRTMEKSRTLAIDKKVDFITTSQGVLIDTPKHFELVYELRDLIGQVTVDLFDVKCQSVPLESVELLHGALMEYRQLAAKVSQIKNNIGNYTIEDFDAVLQKYDDIINHPIEIENGKLVCAKSYSASRTLLNLLGDNFATTELADDPVRASRDGE